ncbi:TPA: acyltransferase, partial [Enterococcus faecium]
EGIRSKNRIFRRIKRKLFGKNLRECINEGLIFGKKHSLVEVPEFGSEPYLIEIGDNFRCSFGVKFITHDGGVWVLRKMSSVSESTSKIGRIKLGNNIFIGIYSIVFPGVSIGDNVIIRANTLVNKDIPNNSVVAGSSCKVISTIEEHYE